MENDIAHVSDMQNAYLAAPSSKIMPHAALPKECTVL
jgi:hypothetical protein